MFVKQTSIAQLKFSQASLGNPKVLYMVAKHHKRAFLEGSILMKIQVRDLTLRHFCTILLNYPHDAKVKLQPLKIELNSSKFVSLN